MNKVTGFTTLLASFGNPNKGNPGPEGYNLALNAMGADYVFLAFEVAEIQSALKATRDLGFGGCIVTKPFKQEIMKYLDDIDSDAQTIGAVNVVVNESGRLKGFNSDWVGSTNALKSKIDIKGKRIALLGAGGAAKAVAFGLFTSGSNAVVFNRTKETGKIVADQYGFEYGGDLNAIDDSFDIIINATSIGFRDDYGSVPVDESVLLSKPLVFDIVASPKRSRLIELAGSLGCETIAGSEMIAFHAQRALKLLTGQEPPLDLLSAHFF